MYQLSTFDFNLTKLYRLIRKIFNVTEKYSAELFDPLEVSLYATRKRKLITVPLFSIFLIFAP